MLVHVTSVDGLVLKYEPVHVVPAAQTRFDVVVAAFCSYWVLVQTVSV